MKTYLFATDFSQTALQALHYAVPLVKRLKGKLILFHAYEFVSPYMEIPANMIEQLNLEVREEGLAQLKIWKDMVSGLAPELSCEVEIRCGKAAQSIKDFAELEKVDGIIMGTKGASGLKKFVMGSVASRTLVNAPCPVLLIPEEAVYQAWEKLVFATDFLPFPQAFFDQLKALAGEKGRLNFLHISPYYAEMNPQQYVAFRDFVKGSLPAEQVEFNIVPADTVEKGLTSYVEVHRPDLLLMLTKRKDWINKLIHGSEVKRHAFHPVVPVLVFHEENEAEAFVEASLQQAVN
ncbi:MAG: universal stress protein [Bacteroidota bacterium]